MAESNNIHAGGTLESFFEDLGERDEVYGAALKRVLAWQFEQCRNGQHLSKAALAVKMGTSRPQLDRVLDPDNVAVSLETLARAAAALGKRLQIGLVDPGDHHDIIPAE